MKIVESIYNCLIDQITKLNYSSYKSPIKNKQLQQNQLEKQQLLLKQQHKQEKPEK